jgi:predicted dehydrogenase
MGDKIKFAVVGCGHIGKRHAEMIRKNDECELVALIDTNTAITGELEAMYNKPVFTSLDAYLASGAKADVLNIATPNGLHTQQALAAIESGHHVVVEKPMGLSKKDTEKLIHKALQNSKQVFCVMQNRYSPPSEWLKQIVTDGVLGKIYMVQVNCYWNRDERYYKKG